MNLSMKTVLLATSMLLWSMITSAQECVNFNFEEDTDGTTMIVDLKVENFNDILSTQLAIAYSTSHLALDQITGNSDLNIQGFNFNVQGSGYVVFVWSNPVTPQVLADGTTLIQMRFNILNSSPSTILVDDQFNTEVIDGSISEVCFSTVPIIVSDNRPVVLGSVLHDTNADCIADTEDIPLSNWKVRLTSTANTYYAFTNTSGNYVIPVEIGVYNVEVLTINDLWTPCTSSSTVNAITENQNYEVPFVITPDQEAPALVVSVNTDQITGCSNNEYYVTFKNEGTAPSTGTKVEIIFDQGLSYIESNFGPTITNGQLITANIGTLEPGEGGHYRITMFADCDATSNQSICAHAEIIADNSPSIPTDWNGAIMRTEAQCEGDSVVYTITNIGILDAVSPLGFIVVEDDVMFQNNDVSLDPAQDFQFKVADNGGAHRIIVDQETGYPYGKKTTAFIPSCNDDNGSFEYISMFSNEDESPLADIECEGAQSVFQSNRKTAYPQGYRANHQIEANHDIEYTINFQNTTNDTVFQIVIEDDLDPSLNIESIIHGSSSHPYLLSIDENRTLKLEIYGLAMPNAITDANNSSGFVSYTIAQNTDLPAGTIIGSDAEITFNGTEVLTTNEFTHQIGENFIEMVLYDEIILLDDEFVTAPNPSSQLMKIEVPSVLSELSYIIYNWQGSVINAANCPSNVFYIKKDLIPNGVYILEVRSNNRPVGTKKIIFQE